MKRIAFAVLNWGFGLFFLMLALGSLVNSERLTAFLCLLVSLLLIPPLTTQIRKKLNLSGWKKSGYISLIIFLILVFSPTTDNPERQLNNSLETVETSTQVSSESSTPEPTPAPTPAPTPEPTPEPTPAPTPEPTSEPTPAPTPEPRQNDEHKRLVKEFMAEISRIHKPGLIQGEKLGVVAQELEQGSISLVDFVMMLRESQKVFQQITFDLGQVKIEHSLPSHIKKPMQQYKEAIILAYIYWREACQKGIEFVDEQKPSLLAQMNEAVDNSKSAFFQAAYHGDQAKSAVGLIDED